LAIALRIEIAGLFDYKNQLEKRTIVKNQQDFITRLSKEKENLGNRISQLCKHRKIDQEELGILSKIASSDISLYINGEENLVLLTLLKIAIGLEVEIVDLFNYDGEMPDNNTFKGKLQF
jgi:DNA-binding Xre family transcriptional regulator